MNLADPSSIQFQTSASHCNDELIQAQEWLRRGNLVEAQTLCRQILAIQPHHVETLLLLGTLLQQRRQWVQAEQAIRQAIRAAPIDAMAQLNLGRILAAQNRHDEAITALKHAIQLQPDDVAARIALGEVLQALNRLQEAITTWRQASALRPADARIHYLLGAALAKLKQDEEALVALYIAHRSHPDDATITLLATVLHRQGRIKEAQRLISDAVFARGGMEKSLALLQHWQSLMPDDPITQHRLSAWSGQETPARAADAYVADLFDHYADSFDQDLGRLEYQAPAAVAAQLAETLPAPASQWRVLDAGCGTGLCGPLLRPWARHLTGVDLSPGMLAKAQERGCYDELVVAELTAFLGEWPLRYELITLVDTLIYFGDLAPALTATAYALQPGGWLAFTVEQALDEQTPTFRLNRSGRYSHTANYVQRTLAAAGLPALHITSVVLRQEENTPVNGYVVLAQRPKNLDSTG